MKIILWNRDGAVLLACALDTDPREYVRVAANVTIRPTVTIGRLAIKRGCDCNLLVVSAAGVETLQAANLVFCDKNVDIWYMPSITLSTHAYLVHKLDDEVLWYYGLSRSSVVMQFCALAHFMFMLLRKTAKIHIKLSSLSLNQPTTNNSQRKYLVMVNWGGRFPGGWGSSSGSGWGCAD